MRPGDGPLERRTADERNALLDGRPFGQGTQLPRGVGLPLACAGSTGRCPGRACAPPEGYRPPSAPGVRGAQPEGYPAVDGAGAWRPLRADGGPGADGRGDQGVLPAAPGSPGVCLTGMGISTVTFTLIEKRLLSGRATSPRALGPIPGLSPAGAPAVRRPASLPPSDTRRCRKARLRGCPTPPPGALARSVRNKQIPAYDLTSG